MATPARLAGVGAFVLGGLLLFAVGLFMIGDRQMAFAKKFTIYTEFKKITGLQPGAIVRVSGAKAGAITQIVPPNGPSGKFRVELEITEELHPLVRTDSLATIETEGLVGGSYLGVGTGSEQAPAAPPKSTIPSKEPFEISDLMQQMGDTIAKVNKTIDEMKDDVQRAVVVDRRHGRQRQRADHRRQRRREEDGGGRRADQRGRRADLRGAAQRQGDGRQAVERRRALPAGDGDREAGGADRRRHAAGRRTGAESPRGVPGEGRAGPGRRRRPQGDDGRCAHRDGRRLPRTWKR